MIWLLVGSFGALLVLGAPLAFALAVAVVAYLVFGGGGQPGTVIVQQMYTATNSFPLLAVPFFLLAGDLMGRAKLTDQLLDFSRNAVGWMRGGLAHANVLASMLFAGVSGSAIADTAAIGKLLIPAMEREGFDRADASALTAAASIIGPIIPPSIPMVIFGSTFAMSIGALFAAGMIPGVIIGLSLMALSFAVNLNNQVIARHPFSLRRLGRSTIRAFVPLMMPVILIGGILGGVFTPTEAGAVASGYGLLVGAVFYRTLRPRDIWESLVDTSKNTAVILLIIAAANPFSWLLSVNEVPQTIATAITHVSSNPLIVLLLINVLLLVAGLFIETVANILILGPILLPIAKQIGIQPVHFAMIMIVNLLIGLITPPVGLCLFSTAAVADVKFERIVRRILPYLAVELGVLVLVIFVPALSLAVPHWLGLL